MGQQLWDDLEQAAVSWDAVEALAVPYAVLEEGRLLEFLKEKGVSPTERRPE